MGSGSIGSKLAAAAAIAALALAAPGPAWGIRTRSAFTSTPVDGLLTATARCERGEHVISGGYQGGDGEYALASRRQGPRGWTVTVQSSSAPSLIATAYCGTGPRLAGHSRTETVIYDGIDNQGAATARCDRGERVVSGGFQTLDAEVDQKDLAAFKSRRVRARRWRVDAVTDGGANARLRVFAYCRRNVEVKQRSSSEAIGANADGLATARCRPGEGLLSGGYSTSPETDYYNMTGPDLFYHTSFRLGDRGWTARAHNYSNSPAGGTITAFAYCR
jgi:hypothetical protein